MFISYLCLHCVLLQYILHPPTFPYVGRLLFLLFLHSPTLCHQQDGVGKCSIVQASVGVRPTVNKCTLNKSEKKEKKNKNNLKKEQIHVGMCRCNGYLWLPFPLCRQRKQLKSLGFLRSQSVLGVEAIKPNNSAYLRVVFEFVP